MELKAEKPVKQQAAPLLSGTVPKLCFCKINEGTKARWGRFSAIARIKWALLCTGALAWGLSNRCEAGMSHSSFFVLIQSTAPQLRHVLLNR